MPEILDLNKDKLSVKAIHIFERLYEQFKTYEEQVLLYEKDIEADENLSRFAKKF